MSQTVALRGVRFGWVDVVKTSKKYPDNFRAQCILDPDSVEDKKLQEAIYAAAVDKWGEGKARNFVRSAEANGKVCRTTTIKPDKNTGEPPEHLNGKAVLNAGRRFKRDGAPSVYCARLNDAKKVVKVHEESNFEGLVRPVPGSFGDVIVNVWAFEHEGSPQVNCTLETIVFRDQGEPIRTRQPISDEKIAETLGIAIEEDELNIG